MTSRIAIAALASVFLAVPAIAAEDFGQEFVIVANPSAGLWTFTQGGFTDGATISGFFEGSDLDGNGQLSFFSGEVSNFGVDFSGNSLVGAFTLDYGNLFGLVYDLDGGPLGDGLALDVEGIGADNGIYSYVAGPGPFNVCTGANDCGRVTGPDIIVPEPASWAMLIAGFGLVGVAVRRRKPVMA